MNQSLCTPADHRLSRRGWLGTLLGASALAASGRMQSIAEEIRNRRKQVLFIWLDGGISQLESWDPKPNTVFGGPFRAIPTSVPGIHISELLPQSARLMNHLALLRSVSTKDNSHSAGVERIQRGDPKNRGVVYPYFGSAVAKWIGPGDGGLPPYVVIKPGNGGFLHQDAGFLGPRYGAIAFGDGKPPENLLRPTTMSEAEDAERNQLRLRAEKRYAAQRDPAASEAHAHTFEMAAQWQRHRALFDTSTFTPRDVERYGKFDLGRHLLLARRMLESGVTFVKVTSYGWDTHGDHFNGSLSLVRRFDQSFSAVIEDLHQRGMLDHVLVIAMSEFGRTPRINGHLGRDHWPEAWSIAMAGCGLNKGIAVGKTNARGTEVAGDAHDIGHVFHTWFRALGINSHETEYDNAGQPLPIAHDDCRAVSELLA